MSSPEQWALSRRNRSGNMVMVRHAEMEKRIKTDHQPDASGAKSVSLGYSPKWVGAGLISPNLASHDKHFIVMSHSSHVTIKWVGRAATLPTLKGGRNHGGNDSPQEKCETLTISEPSLKLLFETLDLTWVEARVASKYSQRKRRPPLPGIPLIRAHLFKDIRQIKSYRKLQRALAEHDGLWAQSLGFEKPPHHDSFSAFRRRLGPELFIEIFRELRTRLMQLKPDLAEVIAIDSTSIQAYARSGRGQRKSSDPDAKWGIRINPKTSKKEHFFGYKLHTALSAKYGAPLDFRVTPGNVQIAQNFPNSFEALSGRKGSFQYCCC